MTRVERLRSKFRGNEEEDARRPGLRIAANLPPDEIDDRLEFSFREGVFEVIRTSVGEETACRASCSDYTQEVRARQEESSEG